MTNHEDINRSSANNAERHCRHPQLKNDAKGEKICVHCGRTVYSAQKEKSPSSQQN